VNRLEAAVVDVVSHLEGHRVPYMVIGGFANLYWGRPRLTQDVDIKIEVAESAWADLIANLRQQFSLLAGDPLGFLRETRVIPLATRGGVGVDLVLVGLPYEEEAIRRAVGVDIGGKSVRICTAEDLIIHKIVSDRIRDRDDVEGVILSRARLLDRTYLDPKIREVAQGLERPDIEDFYHSCLKKAGLGGS
jgi:hypothetical protein